MIEPGNPQSCVNKFTPIHREEYHDRLQPQGRGRFGARQPDHRRSGRAAGKRDSRIHQVSQRRSGSGGSHALHQSLACGIVQAGRICRLHGAAPPPAQIAAQPNRRVCVNLRRQVFGFLVILILLIAVLLLTSCGHPKEAGVNAPPPPPPPVTEPTEQPEPGASATLPPPHVPPTKEKSSPDGSEENSDLAEPVIPAGTKALSSESGLASWYGPPYHT